ncbi:MAG: hypothetical protein ACLP8A_00510 [Methylovirgula sp.]
MNLRAPSHAYISDIGPGAKEIILAHASRLVKEPYNLCRETSIRLSDDLLCHGVQAQVMRCHGLKTDAPDADARWLALAVQSFWIHFVVKVGTDVVDLTRRQFFPLSGYPFVQSVSACETEWDSFGVDVPRSRFRELQ